MNNREINVTVNGQHWQRCVSTRLTLADFLRHELGLTGTHVGCEHGACGACTIMFDGESMRSCLIFAVQAEGHAVTTVEGLATPLSSPHLTTEGGTEGGLHPIQQSFWEAHGLQCGYCT